MEITPPEIDTCTVNVILPVVNIIERLLNDSIYSYAKCEDNKQVLCDYVNQKAVMVVDPYAVVNPRTMVVKSLNTLIADAAVSRSSCPNRLAIWTQGGRFVHLEQLDKRDLIID